MLRVAIVGAGRIAQTVTEVLKKSKSVKVVAIASRDMNRANDFKVRNGLLYAFGDYDSLIEFDEYDVIYIATVNSTHYDIAKKCLLARRPVFIEKPMCMNADQVQELVCLSQREKVFLAEAMPIRYSSNMKRVLQIIGEGKLGNISLAVSCLGISNWGAERIRDSKIGGGSLYDLGVYGVTLARMIFKADGTVTSLNNEENNVDSQNTFVISYKESQFICFNSVRFQTKNIATIYGDKGRIYIKESYNADRVVFYSGIRKMRIYKNTKNIYVEEFEAVAQALNAGLIEPKEYPHYEIIASVKIMDKIRNSWIDNSEK